MNQYGLWVGLGDREMTMIDYACGVGALSQVSGPFFAFLTAKSHGVLLK